MTESNQDAASTLMTALITKMESMDSDIHLLKAENQRLRRMISNPNSLMKKMGLVSMSTPFAEDVQPDGFREDLGEQAVLKGIDSPSNNLEFHNTSWDDIHEMADQAKAAGHVDEPFKVISGRDES